MTPAPHDPDCEGETVGLSFGSLPTGVVAGPQDTATVTISDDDICSEFDSSTYTVNEGSSVSVTVELSRASSRSLTIPVVVSPGTNRSVSIARGRTSGSFSYPAPHDPDCEGETVGLSFGSLPTGVVAGSQDTATVTISDDDICAEFDSSTYTVNEGSSVSVTVELSRASSRSLTIPVVVSPGTNRSVSIARGRTSGSFSYPAPHDPDCEGETVGLSFGSLPTGVVAGPQDTATVTISDDDICAEFDSSTYTVNEGSSVSVTVELSRASSRSLTIPVVVSPGTNRSVSIARGRTSGSFSYPAPHDPDCEGETVGLSFGSLPTGVVAGPQDTATVTISDDDICAEFDSSTYTVNEGSSVSVTVELSRASSRSLTIPVVVSPGTNRSVSIARGRTSGSFSYPAPHDPDCEGETVGLSFGSLPTGVVAGPQDTATVTISDDDICAEFDSSTYTVNEGSSVSVTVELSRASSRSLTIPVVVSPGTNRSVSIARGRTSGSFSYPAPHDPDCEGETVGLSFGSLPTGVVAGPQDTATVTISDDDICAEFDSSTYTVNEGSSVSVTVELSRASSRSLTIPVVVSPGTNRSVSIARGRTSGSFSYPAPHDPDCEGETVDLSFGSLPTGVVAGSQDTATVTISDDDICFELTGSADSVRVGRTVELTVSASGLSSSVDYTVLLSRPDSNSDIGFDFDCSDASKTLVPPTRGSSFDLNATLYTCDELGGTVTAQLRAGGSNVSGDTHRVNVSVPTISFSGATAVENGDDASVSVAVGNLDSMLTYTVEVTASSRVALNSACDDRTDSYSFRPSSSSWNRSITVQGCSVGEADLSVEVSLSGPGTVASESHEMTVTDPQVELTGSASSVNVGRTVELTVAVSGLDPNVDYSVLLTRPDSNSDIGFDSDCSDASKTLVPSTRGTSFDLDATLYTCDSLGGTVTAQLRAGGSDVSGDTHRVNVSVPTILFTGVMTVAVGEEEDIDVTVDDLDSTLTYTVKVTASSDIALDDACSDREDSISVSPTGSSWSQSVTVHGCSAGSAVLSVEVRLPGPGAVASRSFDITAVANRPPEFGQSRYSFDIDENVVMGDEVGVVLATDMDVGDSVSYSITGGTGRGNLSIEPMSGKIKVAGMLDYEVASSYTLEVEASDGNGGTDEAIVSIDVNNVDEPGVVTLQIASVDEHGVVTFQSAPAEVDIGTRFKATLSDPDRGVLNPSWQWESSSTGATWATIAGATFSEYTPAQADAGMMLRASVTYTDAQGPNKRAVSSQAELRLPQLAKPTGPGLSDGLDVVPLLGQTVIASSGVKEGKRSAKVIWNPVPNANAYVLEITEGSQTCIKLVFDTFFEVDLDRIIPDTCPPTLREKGLADSKAYEFRVKATDMIGTPPLQYSESEYSAPVTIVDTPITKASGKSPKGGSGKATLESRPISDILSPGYGGGTPSFLYRTMTSMGLGTGVPTGDNPITGLTQKQVYAIQWRYEKSETPPGHTEPVITRVYAARDVYVWPSDEPAMDGEDIATFELEDRVKDTYIDSSGKKHSAYVYRICEETFPDELLPDRRNKREAWRKLIRYAFGQWELASAALVRTVHLEEECTDYSGFIDHIANSITTEVGIQVDMIPAAELRKHVAEHLSRRQNLMRVRDLHGDDSARNEVLMFDDVKGPIKSFVDASAFPEFAKQLGFVGECWEPTKNGHIARACVAKYPDEERHDMFIRREPFEADMLTLPGDGDEDVEREDVKFNQCQSVLSAHETLLHEAGHALGIKGRPHPGIPSSVMNLLSEPDCSPHPLDIMAIYALYQIPVTP